MKIAYDARSLFRGGTGDVSYFRALLRAAAHLAPQDEFHLYYRDFDPEREAIAAQFANVSTHGVPFPVGWLWNQAALAPRLKRDGMDVLHSQYLLPRFAPRPMVVTVHDITFRLFPEWFPPRPRKLMNALIPMAAHAAQKIITGSQCAKDDIAREFGVSPEKIVVTPYAAAPHFAASDPFEARRRLRELYPALGDAFIAAIGLRGVRKNIGVVLRAMLQLQARGAWPAVKLALAGSREQFPDPEIAALEDHIVFLGYADDAVLPLLFSGARACVYPSLYEGFGLPVLEAMACGCAVLCSDTSSLPEVGGEAAMLLSPTDESAWATALERILSDDNERARRRTLGLERATLFSWDNCAAQTLAVYRDVCGG